jgi:hypothetical protein
MVERRNSHLLILRTGDPLAILLRQGECVPDVLFHHNYKSGMAVYSSNKFVFVFARIFGEYEHGNLHNIRRIRIRIWKSMFEFAEYEYE